jgi:hypothetical protein
VRAIRSKQHYCPKYHVHLCFIVPIGFVEKFRVGFILKRI